MGVDLHGKVIVVTGGIGNLGRAVAAAAVAAGARVTLIDRMPQHDMPSAQSLHGCSVIGDVDLASFDSARAAMAKVLAASGKLDALINVAGGFHWGTVADDEVEAWDHMYCVNLKTAVVATKAALPYLLADKGGRIVNVGAVAATKAAVGMGAYAAAKSGVLRLTETLADELKGRGCTVNAVLPSIIDTPQNRRDMPDADYTRWVSAESVANVIMFLLSEQANAVTGAAIPVAGKA